MVRYYGLEGKDGFAHRYSFEGGHFTTVTRVVAATEGGTAKVIIAYSLEALSAKEAKMREPWKDNSDAKAKMVLMRLRVMETPNQLAAFGWNTIQRPVIPLEMDRDYFFPQYVPVRERCTAPEFCVTWVRKVSEFRELPKAEKADPPPLTTGLLFGTSEKELADPYNLATEWTGEDKIPDELEPG